MSVNISKSYVWTVKKEVDMKVIYAVMNTNWAVVEITQCFQNLNRHSRNTLTPKYFKFSPFLPLYQYTYSPHCSLYISSGADKENLFANQKVPSLVIISFSKVWEGEDV